MCVCLSLCVSLSVSLSGTHRAAQISLGAEAEPAHTHIYTHTHSAGDLTQRVLKAGQHHAVGRGLAFADAAIPVWMIRHQELRVGVRVAPAKHPGDCRGQRGSVDALAVADDSVAGEQGDHGAGHSRHVALAQHSGHGDLQRRGHAAGEIQGGLEETGREGRDFGVEW